MVTAQRLLFVVQVALLLLLSSSMTLLTQAWFAILLLSKAYQLATTTNESLWSLKRANLLAVVGIVLFLLLLPQLGVVHLMMHFLFFAAVLRLLSLRWHHKDAEQLFLVHYILLACAVILQQQFWFSAAVIVVALINLYAQWIWSAQADDTRVRDTGTMLISSGVLTVLMFFVVPHLPPFWQVPSPKVAKTGIAAELAVNDISQLLKSDALAFRAAFDNPSQATASPLYFRARIYHRFDGQRWTSPDYLKPFDFSASAASIGYQLIVEPHQQQWLFNLGVATDVSNADIKTSQFGIVYRQKPLAQRISYHVISALAIPRTEQSVRAFLQLPDGLNPRTVQRGQQAILQNMSTAQVIEEIKRYFLANNFAYTTSPGNYPSADSIDVFMEQGRKGFCVHYAQATVIWLRAAGVPARLVGGYLGGQWQNGDEYLRVTQADAHAWVEYLDGQEWKLFDPTMLIYPELSLSQDETSANALFGQLSGDFWGPGHFGGFLIQLARDLDYYWAMKVLSFEQEDQQQVRSLIQDWVKQHWLELLSGLAVLLTSTGLWFQVRRWQSRPLGHRLLGALYRYKAPEETVNQLFERLIGEHPNHEKALRRVQQGYHELVYQRHAQPPYLACYVEAQRLARQLRHV